MLNDNQLDLSRKRLEKAREDLLTASENMQSNRNRAASNRAYYSIFHSIRALLALDGVDFKTHSQVLGYFNKNYIHTGDFGNEYGKLIISKSTSRNKSDYDDEYIPTYEEAKEYIRNAEKLFEAIEQHIEQRVETN